ncbi:hypothetical protein EYC84_002776 [Monilinia fructicola]|uniref:Mediator of RNA polymerase II transcription subunit 4 n=1 Tax=Monilinia fructicola TaxID=38448 RepID=A0A5M9JP76_MONFR|nr:hypothetical protein EYC84_002776 [Monilinia fructicola]
MGSDDRPFVPWAREDDIRIGALASIQALVDSGIDPEGWDPELEEQKKREKAERDREGRRGSKNERGRKKKAPTNRKSFNWTSLMTMMTKVYDHDLWTVLNTLHAL